MRRLGPAIALLLVIVGGCARVPGGAGSSPMNTVELPTAPVVESPAAAGPTDAATQQLGLGGVGHLSYPQSWLQGPGYPSMVDSPLGIISSIPVDPCTTASCQFYTVPSNGVVLEFHYSDGQVANWAAANDAIGGMPAIREDWGSANAHDADEGHTWRVRMPNGVLTIYASIKGPDLNGGRAALQAILATLAVGP